MIISENFKKHPSTVVEVECDIKNCDKCKNIYKTKYRYAIRNLKNNFGKIRCKYCTICGINNTKFKHGSSKKDYRLYHIWRGIRNRCLNKKSNRFPRYGGRGIKICNGWSNNFTEFEIWSIKNGYNNDLTIDRIDNDGNYEPNNCRWITLQQNSFNRGSLVGSASIYKGVTIIKNKTKKDRYRASISINNKSIHIGYFDNEEEAAKAYNEKAKELFGEFSYINKIEN
jgi:hypothetical protein